MEDRNTRRGKCTVEANNSKVLLFSSGDATNHQNIHTTTLFRSCIEIPNFNPHSRLLRRRRTTSARLIPSRVDHPIDSTTDVPNTGHPLVTRHSSTLTSSQVLLSSWPCQLLRFLISIYMHNGLLRQSKRGRYSTGAEMGVHRKSFRPQCHDGC